MISDIQNGELGSSVRAKLNQAIADINGIPTQLAAKLDVTDFDWATLPNKPSTFPSNSNSGNPWTKLSATQTSKQNSTAFSAISGLTFSIPDFYIYEVNFWIKIQATAGSAGVKWSTSAPAGSLGVVEIATSLAPTPTYLGINAASGGLPVAASMPSSLLLVGNAKFLAGDDGDFSLNFAQSTSSANAIIVLPESRLEYRIVS